MRLTCFKNGKKIELDPLDLDYIEYDVIKDYLTQIEHLEKNPLAEIKLDLTEPFVPKYNLINCSNIFSEKFNQIITRRKPA
ncbi:MAG: hypothetical protein MI739_09310 [Bacteroidales bacterium]|nr:hypothetical protein [Bacteroidales bacterium]